MISTITTFPALYLTTLPILVSTGLFNTYMGLRLSADSVSEVWIGMLIDSIWFWLLLRVVAGVSLDTIYRD